MNKIAKLIMVGVTSLSLVGTISNVPNLNASAKVRSSRQLSVKKIKKTAYHVYHGYMYSSTKLTKKTHNAANFPRTTFYATKSAKIKKPNGKTAVYYYISNKSGKVKGWIWHSELKKIVSYKQAKADIKFVDGAIHKFKDADGKYNNRFLSDSISYCKADPRLAYASSNGLPNVYRQFITAYDNGDLLTPDNLDVAQSLYDHFKNRFNPAMNYKLQLLDKKFKDERENYRNEHYGLLNLGSSLNELLATTSDYIETLK